MKIEIKRVKYYSELSEETNAFTADLWIDGKKVGHCKNDGQGGCTDYRPDKKEDWSVIRDAEAYCNSLPPIKSSTFEIQMTLEYKIDYLLLDYFDIKANNNKGILVRKGNEPMLIYRFNKSINQMKKTEDDIKRLKSQINRLKLEGYQILNTNLHNYLT